MKKNLPRLLALCLALCLALAIPLGRVSAAEPELSTEGATSFVFSEDGITAQDGLYTAYQIKGTALTIQGAGTYLVSGRCSDGPIKIKKGHHRGHIDPLRAGSDLPNHRPHRLQ